jgi:hypothetical protein
MNFTKDQVITFLGGGLVVFVLEQVFRYFRRERRVLGYIVDTRTLVEKSDADLKITYKELEVERVYSHGITIKNIGNACLRDVPVFILPSAGKFFFAQVGSKPGIHCPQLKEGPGFAFTFNLLNPGDEIKVQLVVLDSKDSTIQVDARAEKLFVKDISNVKSVTQVLDLMVEGSSGFTWAFLKGIRLALSRID